MAMAIVTTTLTSVAEAAVFSGLVPGTRFAVDRFRGLPRSTSLVFLTHFHADHYEGLDETWNGPPIVCSPLTLQFALHRFPALNPRHFIALEPMEAHSLSLGAAEGSSSSSPESFLVRLLPANHCPGSVMILLEGGFGRLLHTGDMRYSAELGEVLKPVLRGGVSRLFLDTTFAIPFWRSFPSKSEAASRVVELIARSPPSTRILIDCEMLGHEELVLALHLQLSSKIFVEPSRLVKLSAITELSGALTSDESATRVFVTREGSALFERLRARFGPNGVLVIKPSTQWFGQRGQAKLDCSPRRDEFGAWHVLYSIHSSLEELESFVALTGASAITPITRSCPRHVLDILLRLAQGQGQAQGQVSAQASALPKKRERAHSLDERELKRRRVTLSSVLAELDAHEGTADAQGGGQGEREGQGEAEDEAILYARLLLGTRRRSEGSENDAVRANANANASTKTLAQRAQALPTKRIPLDPSAQLFLRYLDDTT